MLLGFFVVRSICTGIISTFYNELKLLNTHGKTDEHRLPFRTSLFFSPLSLSISSWVKLVAGKQT